MCPLQQAAQLQSGGQDCHLQFAHPRCGCRHLLPLPGRTFLLEICMGRHACGNGHLHHQPRQEVSTEVFFPSRGKFFSLARKCNFGHFSSANIFHSGAAIKLCQISPRSSIPRTSSLLNRHTSRSSPSSRLRPPVSSTPRAM